METTRNETLIATIKETQIFILNSSFDVLACLSGCEEGISSLAFDYSGQKLASGHRDCLCVWNIAGKTLTHKIDSIGNVIGLCFDRYSERLFAQCVEDYGVRCLIVDLSSSIILRAIGLNTICRSQLMGINGNDDYFITRQSEDDDNMSHHLKFWNITTTDVVHTCAIHRKPIFSLALSADGSVAATGSNDDAVYMWDAHTGELRHTLEVPSALGMYQVLCMAFSADGSKLVLGGQQIVIFDLVSLSSPAAPAVILFASINIHCIFSSQITEVTICTIATSTGGIVILMRLLQEIRSYEVSCDGTEFKLLHALTAERATAFSRLPGPPQVVLL